MTVSPAILTPLGRTCEMATARSRSRISIPTPVPKASSVRISMPEKLIPPRVVVPTHDVIRGVVTGGHHLDHGADASPQIRQLAVLQPHPRRRSQRKYGVTAYSQASCCPLSEIAQVAIVQEWLSAPPLYQALYLLWR